MCASYESRFNVTELKLKFWLKPHQLPLNLPDLAEVRPTDPAPTVRRDVNGEREAVFARWEIWKAGMKGYTTWNCRAEDALEKRLFAPLVGKRRALIPATAYFEFTGAKSPKTRWRFTVDGGEPFAFAGLWDEGYARDNDPKGYIAGQQVLGFTVMTTAPNDFTAQYHPKRMPVILDPADYEAWLDPANDHIALSRPFPAERMSVVEFPRPPKTETKDD